MKKFDEKMPLMERIEILAAGSIKAKACLAALITTMGPDSIDLLDLIKESGIEGDDILVCIIGICKGDLNLVNMVFRIESVMGGGELKAAVEQYKAEHPGEDVIKEAIKQRVAEIRESAPKREVREDNPNADREQQIMMAGAKEIVADILADIRKRMR